MAWLQREDGTESPGERLAALTRALSWQEEDRRVGDDLIAVSEAQALIELRAVGVLTQAELARRLGLDKSTVSRLVAGLEARDWISRQPSPDDRRAHLVELRWGGRTVADRLAGAREEKFQALLARIPEQERAGVLRSLQVLAAVR